MSAAGLSIDIDAGHDRVNVQKSRNNYVTGRAMIAIRLDSRMRARISAGRLSGNGDSRPSVGGLSTCMGVTIDPIRDIVDGPTGRSVPLASISFMTTKAGAGAFGSIQDDHVVVRLLLR